MENSDIRTGAPQTETPKPKGHCTSCGAQLKGSFCGNCGKPAAPTIPALSVSYEQPKFIPAKNNATQAPPAVQIVKNENYRKILKTLSIVYIVFSVVYAFYFIIFKQEVHNLLSSIIEFGSYGITFQGILVKIIISPIVIGISGIFAGCLSIRGNYKLWAGLLPAIFSTYALLYNLSVLLQGSSNSIISWMFNIIAVFWFWVFVFLKRKIISIEATTKRDTTGQTLYSPAKQTPEVGFLHNNRMLSLSVIAYSAFLFMFFLFYWINMYSGAGDYFLLALYRSLLLAVNSPFYISIAGILSGVLSYKEKYKFKVALLPALLATWGILNSFLVYVVSSQYMLGASFSRAGFYMILISAIFFWGFIFLKRKKTDKTQMKPKRKANPVIPMAIGAFSLLAGILLTSMGSSMRSDVYNSLEWKFMSDYPPGGEDALTTGMLLMVVGIILLVAAIALFVWGGLILYKLKAKLAPVLAQNPYSQAPIQPLPNSSVPSTPIVPPPVVPASAPIAQKLKELENLRASNLITEEEYQQKRKEYISSL